MKKSIIILFMLLLNLDSFACECAIRKLSEWQKLEVENSECIFIGEVTNVFDSDNTFEIKVIESLDGGDSIGNTYLGKNWSSCHPFINEKGKWIIYANMEDDYLRLNACGISRSFKEPDYLIQIIPTPDVPQSEKEYIQFKKDGTFEKWKTENRKQSVIELKKEIVALRKRRDE